jgi:hypothetical protein
MIGNLGHGQGTVTTPPGLLHRCDFGLQAGVRVKMEAIPGATLIRSVWLDKTLKNEKSS